MYDARSRYTHAHENYFSPLPFHNSFFLVYFEMSSEGVKKTSDLKIILLGDSAVGKSKLVERFLLDKYNPRELSTY